MSHRPLNETMSPEELARFRAKIFGNLEQKRASGELTEEEYAAKKAQVEADPDLQPPRPPDAAAPRDVAQQLTDLADLHDRGVLTDAEFAAQKANLLGSS